MKADKHPSGIPAPPQQPKPLYNLTPLSQVLLQSKRDLALLRANRSQIAIASPPQAAAPGPLRPGTAVLPTTPRSSGPGSLVAQVPQLPNVIQRGPSLAQRTSPTSPRPGSIAAQAPQLPNVIQRRPSALFQSLSPAQPRTHSLTQTSSGILAPNQGQGLGLVANAAASESGTGAAGANASTTQLQGGNAIAGQAQTQQTVDFDAMDKKLDLFISFYEEVSLSFPLPCLLFPPPSPFRTHEKKKADSKNSGFSA
jgi:hypothetical protein